MATKTEVERKYEVPVDFVMPELTGVGGVASVGDPTEHQLAATYYDTGSLRLAAQGVTLRRRKGGSDAGWHLKRPAGADRTETHLPLTDGRTVPPEIITQVRALSRAEPLAPVARIRTRRAERLLCDADGTVLALLADDVVASEALGERALVQQWRELEIELVDGQRPVLDAVDEALRAAGARPATVPSKLAHALADRYPREPEPDDTDPGQILNRYLRQQRDAITKNDPGVRRGDPDAVHDMRVAARRLRSTLRTFRPVLDAARTEPLRGELQWLGGVLGAVRDGDVMARRLDNALAAEPPELVLGPVAARIRGRLAKSTAEAREKLIAALDSQRYVEILDALDEIAEDGSAARPTDKRLQVRARKALRRADRRMDAALRADRDRNEKLHAARKAYKRARYAAEVLAPLAGNPARRLAKRLSALQDVLGAHQDSIVTGDLLRSYGVRAHLDGDNAFTYGLLHARQHESGERVLSGLDDARRRAARPKVRRWLKA
jgi:CHAD domain-containing protein